jgi:hypothetical protein
MDAGLREVDYLVIGAGAAGMAFTDTLLTETDATIALVDRRHRPGGHWNDAYPFVRLHQPSHYYGVNSRPLGSGGRDAQGFNKGLSELASGAEVLSYFDGVMRQQFLPTGRVSYWPMSEVVDDQTIVSRLSGERRSIKARKVVDAAYMSPAVPATTQPKFPIAPGTILVPVGELPDAVQPGASYVVIGAGKTGIDACLWLLENGINPGQIRWIMPRDSWFYDRAAFQPGREGFLKTLNTVAGELESLAEAGSLNDLFARLEGCGAVLRLDKDVWPTMHHCATVTHGELEVLRGIRNIVRMGRIQRIELDRIVLDKGEIPTDGNTIHVNCSACAFAHYHRPPRPIFDGRHITLQFTRTCAPTFSAAFVAHVEATYKTDAQKNALCPAVPGPTDAVGWLRIMAVDLLKEVQWSMDPEISAWLAQSRLNLLQGLADLKETDVQDVAAFERYMRNVEPALSNLKTLLAQADGPQAG